MCHLDLGEHGDVLGDLGVEQPGQRHHRAVAGDEADRAGKFHRDDNNAAGGVCGPIPLANAVTVSDRQLIRGWVTDAAAGSAPFADGSGITLGGSTGYTAETTVTSTPPQNFTEVVWFKTAGTAGGVLMG